MRNFGSYFILYLQSFDVLMMPIKEDMGCFYVRERQFIIGVFKFPFLNFCYYGI
jgi:hypothetical protein